MFRFPNPVNDKAARTVAAVVVVLCVLTIVLTLTLGHAGLWLTVPLAYGFVARVATGPTLSPLGQFATRVAAPRLGAARLVPGPPKRFAQGVGATLSLLAAVFGLALHWDVAALVCVGLILVAASLESGLGFCLGCWMFGHLMRLGVIPDDTCEACNNITARLEAAT